MKNEMDNKNEIDDETDASDSVGAASISSFNETLSFRMQSQITDFALVSWFKKDTIDSNRGNKKDRGYLNNLDQEYIGALIEIKRATSQ